MFQLFRKKKTQSVTLATVKPFYNKGGLFYSFDPDTPETRDALHRFGIKALFHSHVEKYHETENDIIVVKYRLKQGISNIMSYNFSTGTGQLNIIIDYRNLEQKDE